MKRKISTYNVLLVLVFSVFCTPWALADMLTHGRISLDSGGVLIKGGQDHDWAHAAVNTLILPGDTLWVDKGGVTEIELPGATFLRMADGSKIEMSTLPPVASMRGWQGSFYLQRLSRSEGSLVFSTPACSVELEPDTTARLDILSSGATTVTVRWGRALVRTDSGGGQSLHSGYRMWIDPGMLPSEAVQFDRSVEDSFDQWNRERAQMLATGTNSAPASVGVTQPVLGINDLASYGEWVDVGSRTYWRPTAVVDYVPYRNGCWNYVPAVGHCWVGAYPFCYTTSHYGRWSYNNGYGWLWCYDPVWSPAWAATVRCGDYYIWSPVDYYNRPVCYGSASFMVGGVSFGLNASSYCRSDYLYNGYNSFYCMNPQVMHHVQNNYTQINIWNINGGRRRPIPVPYDNSIGRVRDYNPRRSIRGAGTYARSGVPSKERVRQLEASRGRAQFAASSRSSGAGIRTASHSVGRKAPGRRVDVASRTYAGLKPSSRSRVNASAGRSTVPPSASSRSLRGGGATPSKGPQRVSSVSRSNTSRVSAPARTPSRSTSGTSGRSLTSRSGSLRSPAPSSSSRTSMGRTSPTKAPTTSATRNTRSASPPSSSGRSIGRTATPSSASRSSVARSSRQSSIPSGRSSYSSPGSSLRRSPSSIQSSPSPRSSSSSMRSTRTPSSSSRSLSAPTRSLGAPSSSRSISSSMGSRSVAPSRSSSSISRRSTPSLGSSGSSMRSSMPSTRSSGSSMRSSTPSSSRSSLGSSRSMGSSSLRSSSSRSRR